MNKSLRLFGQDDVIVGEVYQMLASSFKTVLLQINTKQIQAEEFEKDKGDPRKWTLQIDYAMAYQCMYHDDVRKPLISGEHKPVQLCTKTYRTNNNNNYGHMYRLQV